MIKHKILVDQGVHASKQDQVIKSEIWSKILIAVADGSIGYIAVTTLVIL